MTRVYLSGKMSGLPDLGFPAFHRAAASLRASGYEVINPAELDDADPNKLEWHQYLRRDITHLVTCDVVAMLPNWASSKGARLEKHIAEQLGMEVIFLAQDGDQS